VGAVAALRALKKPRSWLLLNTDEHVLTNPAMRLASQGGSVDLFRFGLQDYERPDPDKAEAVPTLARTFESYKRPCTRFPGCHPPRLRRGVLPWQPGKDCKKHYPVGLA